jgi:hypothetical protein
MKKIALLTGVCAITSGAFAQNSSVIIIPAFQNRFGSIHQPVVVVNNTANGSSAFGTRTFGGSTAASDATGRASFGSSTPATTRGSLDAGTMNIPVFPGNTVLIQQQGGFGFGPGPIVGFPNTGVGGNGGFFIQQGAGTSLQQNDPFRTSTTPGPAVNAVPNPAAAVPTTPAQPTIGNTIPAQLQNPATLLPGQALPGTPNTGVPIQTQPIGTAAGPGSTPNR